MSNHHQTTPTQLGWARFADECEAREWEGREWWHWTKWLASAVQSKAVQDAILRAFK